MTQDFSTLQKRLALHVKKHRIKLKLSQADLAKKLGMTQQYYSQLERGKINPRLRTIAKISLVLGIAVGDLFYTVPRNKAAE